MKKLMAALAILSAVHFMVSGCAKSEMKAPTASSGSARGAPRIEWTTYPHVTFGYEGGVLSSWHASARFKNSGGPGETEFRANLQGVGSVSGRAHLEAGKEYLLTVSGTYEGAFPTGSPSYQLTVSSANAPEDLSIAIDASELRRRPSLSPFGHNPPPERVFMKVALGSIRVKEYVPPPEWAVIEFLSVTPEPGSELHRGDTVTATVRYKLDSSYIDISKPLKIGWVKRLSSDWVAREQLGRQALTGTEGTVTVVSAPLPSTSPPEDRVDLSIEIEGRKKEDGATTTQRAKTSFSYVWKN